MSKPKTTDYDSPWKDISERYFPTCLAFFFPTTNEEDHNVRFVTRRRVRGTHPTLT